METAFICSECSRSFSDNESLNKHKKICKSRTKKFHCSYCKKALSSKQNLKEHEFTHTGELPYICKVPGCGLRFRQGSVLSSHKRIHNIIEKYINDEKVQWVKLTDMIQRERKFDEYAIEKNSQIIQLPPILNPQSFIIPKNFTRIEF